MDLLSRRDHGRRELRRKLVQRGLDADEVDAALDRLHDLGLLDDLRSAESLLRALVRQARGPLRIRQKMRERGFDAELVDQVLSECEVDWVSLCRERSYKRELIPDDHRSRAKLQRSLMQQGFRMDTVMSVVRERVEEEREKRESGEG